MTTERNVFGTPQNLFFFSFPPFYCPPKKKKASITEASFPSSPVSAGGRELNKALGFLPSHA